MVARARNNVIGILDVERVVESVVISCRSVWQRCISYTISISFLNLDLNLHENIESALTGS